MRRQLKPLFFGQLKASLECSRRVARLIASHAKANDIRPLKPNGKPCRFVYVFFPKLPHRVKDPADFKWSISALINKSFGNRLCIQAALKTNPGRMDDFGINDALRSSTGKSSSSQQPKMFRLPKLHHRKLKAIEKTRETFKSQLAGNEA